MKTTVIFLRIKVPTGHRILASLPCLELLKAAIIGHCKQDNVPPRLAGMAGTIHEGWFGLQFENFANGITAIKHHLAAMDLSTSVELSTIEIKTETIPA